MKTVCMKIEHSERIGCDSDDAAADVPEALKEKVEIGIQMVLFFALLVACRQRKELFELRNADKHREQKKSQK